MVQIALAVILIAALAALARFGWNAVRSADRTVSPSCRGCPLAGECEGGLGESAPVASDRTDGAHHGR
jgi:hypothetical protein